MQKSGRRTRASSGSCGQKVPKIVSSAIAENKFSGIQNLSAGR